MSNKKGFNIIEFAAVFLLIYVTITFALPRVFPQWFGPKEVQEGIFLSAIDASVKGDHHPELTIRNAAEEDFVLEDRCPMPPVEVYRISNYDKPGEELTLLETEETTLPCEALGTVAAGESLTIDLAPWKYSLFGEYSWYEVRLPGEEDVSARFNIYEAGTITQIFRTFITKPLLNLLIFIASLLPDHNLGIAIIILTILIKLILFVPTQHAMEGQKRMQKVQPQLDAIRKKYASDPQKMQQETMRMWKEHKINPLQSCLPMLIQFPVLIGLFFVIRDGSVLEVSRHLIYDMYQNLPWSFGTNFFGMDLTVPSYYIMPPFLVVMQFLQMKLSFAIAKKKKGEKEKVVDVDKKKERTPQEIQQQVFQYGLPLMIGFFAFQFPAAVSLYWGVSTVFAIGQQLVVNRKELA